MRNIFPGYYRPTSDEFSEIWNKGIFVLDANVLLNLYAYSSETMQELVSILKGISDRLWIPHQVAFEYQRRRLDVIQQQEAAYETIQKALKNARNKLEQDVGVAVRQGKHPFINLENLLERIGSFFSALEKELDSLKDAHPNFFYEDPIRESITTILEKRVGISYSDERLNEVYELGQKRYDRQIPPGYEDKNKEDMDQYGDLVLWFQIIDKAKNAKKPIILITDDTKTDWWWKFKGKTIGPRPELVQEMMAECNVSFYMYRSDQFMKYARVHLSYEVPQKAIDEVNALIRESDGKKMLNKIRTWIKQEDKRSLSKLLEEMMPSDVADLIEVLDSDERLFIFKVLEPEGTSPYI